MDEPIYQVFSESRTTGEFEPRGEPFYEIGNAEIIRNAWDYGSYIGWIKNLETGEFF